MRKGKKAFLYIVCSICVILIIISIYNIISWQKDNFYNQQIMKKIKENVEIDNTNKPNIDIAGLSAINSECVGWINVKGTNIQYPIVQTTNNEYYLKHSFDKSYNRAGWIFADFRNILDGTDKNIVIYGHNRKDGSMFGSLKNVLKKDWQDNKENRIITLMIGNELYEYEVFSVYSIEKEEYYLKTQFNNEEEYKNYLNRAKSKSVLDFQIDVSIKDKIITLSTCANNNNYRVVVHAKEV